MNSWPDNYPPGPVDDYDYTCLVPLNPIPLPASEPQDVCTKLSLIEGGWKVWPRELVDELISIMAGRGEIAGHGSSANESGIIAYFGIMAEFEEYILANPWVRPLLDPVYLASPPPQRLKQER
jgi:hypothetical protein